MQAVASLYEYFVKDGAQNLTIHKTWTWSSANGAALGEFTGRLHLDFDANAKYVSFFIPEMPAAAHIEAHALNTVPEILKLPETVQIQAGPSVGLSELRDGRELVFTGQIYLYSERPAPEEIKARLIAEASVVGHRLTFCSVEYMNARNKWERPRAFISHDSRDKADIAEKIALQLQKFMCPVWYDQFSLRVGDSLRESIEAGLKECHKCILVLTPNFLNNKGWTKREYETIFTREMVEQNKVILPVWHEISPQDVYQYSPILADRVAVQWSLGVEEVARKLLQAIGA
jgi:hypothetical protein